MKLNNKKTKIIIALILVVVVVIGVGVAVKGSSNPIIKRSIPALEKEYGRYGIVKSSIKIVDTHDSPVPKNAVLLSFDTKFEGQISAWSVFNKKDVVIVGANVAYIKGENDARGGVDLDQVANKLLAEDN